MENSRTFQGLGVFSRTFQDNPVYSSTFQVRANPDNDKIRVTLVHFNVWHNQDAK